MILAFVIWSAVALVFVGLGVHCLRAKDAVGFFSGVQPGKVKDIRRYNRAVGRLWLVFAALLEALGVPLLFLRQNAVAALLIVLGVVALCIGLMIGYFVIETKHKA